MLLVSRASLKVANDGDQVFRIEEMCLHLQLDLLEEFGNISQNGVVILRGTVGRFCIWIDCLLVRFNIPLNELCNWVDKF